MLSFESIRWRRGSFVLDVGPQTLAPGQRVCVIGPSGGGKSSLVRALLGLEAQAQVQGLRWRGRDVSDAAPHQRPFAWLAQDLGLWPHLSARAHVAFARTRGRSVDAEASDDELLDSLGLGARKAARPEQLSGGERQRLAFARALAIGTPWILLDEAFSQLDPVLATELASAFEARARAQGLGVIEVSHHLRRRASDETVWVIEGGRLMQSGSWQQLRRAPATAWAQAFVNLQDQA